MTPVRTTALLSLLGLVAGCASNAYDSNDDAYWRNDPRSLVDAYRDAVNDTGPNALLGVEKLLSAALLAHDRTNAEALAVRASTLVNIYIAGEPGERDALGLLGQEKDKPFKGEPHERVMVDYYLGLLRFQTGDYEGALAAFRSAMNKDRGSYLIPVERDRAREGTDNADRYLYEDNYALLLFLAAKCCQLLDEPEDARKFFTRACEVLPNMKPLFEEGMEADINTLVLVEGGSAPRKQRTGPRGSILGYVPGSTSRLDRVQLGDTDLSFGQCEELHEQATTIGGREVDKLNKSKAERQEILHTAGFATAAAGYFFAVTGGPARSRKESARMQAAGLIAIGVGIAMMLFADAAIDPSADTRAWTTLPGQIYLALGRVAPSSNARLLVQAASGSSDLSQEWTGVPVNPGTINLYWIRLLPGRSGGAWVPAPAASTTGLE